MDANSIERTRAESTQAERTQILAERHRGLRDVAAFVGLATAAVALIAFMARVLDVTQLLFLVPDTQNMRLGTAVGAMAAGAALFLRAREIGGRVPALATGLGLFAAMIGLAAIGQHLTGIELGTADLPTGDAPAQQVHESGSPGLDAALALMGIGLAIAIIHRARLRLTAQILATAAGLLAYFALLEFTFGVASSAGLASYTSMPVVTALCMGLLATGVALARTEGPVLREVVNFNPAIAAALFSFVLLLAVTALTWWWARADRERDAQAAFAYEAASLESRLLAHLARTELVLTSGRSLLGASEFVSRDEWRRFVATLQIENTLPGVLGLGYAQVLRTQDLAAHVAAIRRDGFADYRVWPAGEREVYAPIVYLEPFPERNRRAIGFDMFSEPVRREAATRAVESGEIALSPRVHLVQETGGDPQPGFLMFAPAYQGKLPRSTPAERRAALLGFVYSPFRVGDFMSATMEPPNARVALELYDGAGIDPAALLYTPASSTFPRRPRFTAARTLDVGGHRWTLGFASTPEFESALDHRTPEFILYGGTVVSALIFAIALSLLTGRRRALALADRRTLELRTTNERLVRQTRELERSNAELEQFAYVASHDLREPLRTVTSFTQLLEEEHGQGLQGDARRYMQYIIDGNRRMQMLIDDLLSLSRVGSRTAPHVPLSVAEVLQDVLQALTQALEESGGGVELAGTLPDVIGDRTQLVQLFQNLIGNALKFRSREPPRIRVAAMRDEDWWQLAVADNGIGIDRRYFDRIFVIFQRLHGRGEYPGNGIGLAICKKIVERHGGLIWVESQVGQGATFYFTLRAA